MRNRSKWQLISILKDHSLELTCTRYRPMISCSRARRGCVFRVFRVSGEKLPCDFGCKQAAAGGMIVCFDSRVPCTITPRQPAGGVKTSFEYGLHRCTTLRTTSNSRHRTDFFFFFSVEASLNEKTWQNRSGFFSSNNRWFKPSDVDRCTEKPGEVGEPGSHRFQTKMGPTSSERQHKAPCQTILQYDCWKVPESRDVLLLLCLPTKTRANIPKNPQRQDATSSIAALRLLMF